MHKTQHNILAFSLVELSIVLVILGLLTGGILTGQSLIRAAELRSISTEYSNYTTAVHTFKDKYFALPGDMSNAESFWGTFSVGGGCPAGSGVGTETCNGNGNELYSEGDPDEVAEIFTFWQHLANAGLIAGQYSGISGSDNGFDSIIGVNVPSGKLSGSGWNIKNEIGLLTGDSIYTDNDYIKSFAYGTTVNASVTDSVILTPEEAWNIDSKMDDGKPQGGTIWAIHWDDCTDAATSADVTGEYLLTVTETECALVFRNNF